MTAPSLPALQQSLRYAATLRRLGRRVRVLHAADGPPIVAVERRFGPATVLYLPRADTRGDRMTNLTRLPVSTTRLIIPDNDHPGSVGWPILTPQHIAEINLPRRPVDERLWANMHGKWRNRLRRALDGPLTVAQTAFCPSDHAPLLRLEGAQRRQRGYSFYPPGFLAAWVNVNPHHAPLFIAYHQDDPVAFMLFLTHGRVATYVIGWTGPEGRRLHAHNLLMWSAIQDFFRKGITRIDLGTIDTESGASLARFKLGCGARARTLGPTLLVPPGFRVSP